MNNTSSSQALIQLERVNAQYKQHAILVDVSLTVMPNEIVTLIGPNGAGKTTLVRVILGLINFSGARILKPKLKIGYMPQKLELNAQLPMTVKRFLEVSGASAFELHKRMQQTGVQAIANHSMQNISGGELQRVLLARALMRNPDLLVLDEPAQGVDIHGQAEMYRLIEQIRTEQGCAVLMVSHDLHWVMAQTDKVVCINQHICCQGHPDHISHDPAFIELFGKEVSENLALYTHRHDHKHDLRGNVLQKNISSAQDHHVHHESCHHAPSLLRPPKK